MRRLVPTDELPNAFLESDRGAVPELALGTTQVRGREPHVSRLVAVALNPHLTPQRSPDQLDQVVEPHARPAADVDRRSEEHTSELQSPCNLVCRLLLEKKNKKHTNTTTK